MLIDLPFGRFDITMVGVMWHKKIDDAVVEIEREIERLSTEHSQAVERLKATHEEEMRPLYDALKLLKQVKIGASADDAKKTSAAARPSTARLKGRTNIQAAAQGERTGSRTHIKKSRKFPVKEEVRKMIRHIEGEYSPRSVEKLLDREFPGVADIINHSSVHRALNDLRKSGEILKVGTARYRNKP